MTASLRLSRSLGFYMCELKAFRISPPGATGFAGSAAWPPPVRSCFSVRMSDALEKELAKSSVGLVKAEDYKRKREQLEINEVLGKARADGLAQAPEEVKKKKKKKEKPSGLSFDDELDGEAEVSPKMGAKKMGKCQDVGECCSRRRTPHACRVGCATDTAARSVRARRRLLPQDELARRPGLRTGEGAGEPTAPPGRSASRVRVSRPWAALTTLPAGSPPLRRRCASF